MLPAHDFQLVIKKKKFFFPANILNITTQL